MAQVQQVITEAQKQQAIAIANARCEQFVLKTGYPMEQPLPTVSANLAQQQTYTVTPSNTGIVTGFLLKIDAVVKNDHATEAMTITPHGVANLLRNVEYFDPNNQQRINCSGRTLNLVNSVRGGEPFLEAEQEGTGSAYGDNFKVLLHPVTIAANSSAPLRMFFYIPLAVSAKSDLRGAVAAFVANAQQRLNLTFPRNDQAFVATAGDPTDAIYTGGTGSFTEFNFKVYQHYIDQLSKVTTTDEANYYGIAVGGNIMPLKSLGTYYKIEDSVVSGLAAGAEREIQYGSSFNYLATYVVFANGTELNTGSDVDYMTQQSANQVKLNMLDPVTAAAKIRRLLGGTDLPKGTYCVPNYDKPIQTLTYGNMSLIFKPLVVNQNARLIVSHEYTVESQVLVNAGSLLTA